MPTKKKEVIESEGIAAFIEQAEIHGFPIHEWNTQQFVALYPEIKHITSTFMDAGITLETIESAIASHMGTFGDAVIPCVPNILKFSCPEKTQEERDNLSFPAAIQIVVALLKRNMDHVADFFAQSPK